MKETGRRARRDRSQISEDGQSTTDRKNIKQYQWQNVNPYNQKVVHTKDDNWVFTEEMCGKRLKACNART